MYPGLCCVGDGWTEGDRREAGGAGEDPGASVSGGRPASDGEVAGAGSSVLALPSAEAEGASESLICRPLSLLSLPPPSKSAVCVAKL